MPSFTFTLTIAFALVLVLEGLLYALFPGGIRKMLALAISLPTQQLRVFGLTAAITGAVMVWLLKIFYAG